MWKAVGRRLHCDYHVAGRASASLQKGAIKFIWSSVGENELYDLDVDPDELHNVIAQKQAEADSLAAELRAWRLELRPKTASGETTELDPATKKALESLGYVR